MRWHIVRKILRESDRLRSISDAELEQRSAALRWEALRGVPLHRLMCDAFALVREASRRACGQAHYPVQILAGLAAFRGAVAEMQTGEGKTLAALLPAYLHALAGRGCHVLTANDYLAARDAEFARPIFERLGMTVGCVVPSLRRHERRTQYAADICYGTVKEMGFDFLRDCLHRDDTQATPACEPHHALTGAATVHREFHFALIDEADSVLIDDARTPLVIALPDENNADLATLCRWAHRAAQTLEPRLDYDFDPRLRQATLTRNGCRRVMNLPRPVPLGGLHLEKTFQQVERAICANLAFSRGRDYIVHEGTISIVDESTGRMLAGRKWQNGLHQAIEAKECLPITPAAHSAAEITVQSYFRRYSQLAGLTGTASEAARELWQTYRLRVESIPTHRPCRRIPLPTRVFDSHQSKLRAVTAEIQRMRSDGRAVLVGTPSVEASRALSDLLASFHVPHEVLNCEAHDQEAEIIRLAGRQGQVTVATNMAGRGTDIKVDPAVLDRGGLHVIGTEMHTSPRIDRQLFGRTGRQGEPGSLRQYVSLDDGVLKWLSPRLRQKLRSLPADALGELPPDCIHLFQKAQRNVERAYRKDRRELLRRENERRKRFQELGLDPQLDAAL